MKAFKFIYIALIIFCPLIVSSCKKSGKEIVEKIATETTEKTAKGFAKEASVSLSLSNQLTVALSLSRFLMSSLMLL